MLKDAGLVQAQDLNLEEFSQAVQSAYRGYPPSAGCGNAGRSLNIRFLWWGDKLVNLKVRAAFGTTVLEAIEIAED